jgi:hypothetical protein
MKRQKYLIVSGFIPALSLGLTLGLLCLLNSGSPIRAAPVESPVGEWCVCTSGCDYSSVQDAVDKANDGDIIKVATGVYTDIQMREGTTQVVYISKSITLRGGYTITNCEILDPEANPTTLDAQNGGRVVFLIGSVNVVLENLRITGGNTTDRGGGIYSHDATLTLSNTIVISNSASIDGGGVCIAYGSATLVGGQIINNKVRGVGEGGGVYIAYGSATLDGGQIISNTAWNGGGVRISGNTAVFTQTGSTSIIAHNIITNNGGGVYVGAGSVMLKGGQISDNNAGDGGGVFILSGSATLSGGQILSNTARWGGGVHVRGATAAFTQTGASTIAYNTTIWGGWGGGVYVDSGRATFSGGQVISNSAYNGGGVFISWGSAVLSGGQIISNSATQDGGGVYVGENNAIFTQTGISTIAHNTATYGGGVYVWDGSATLSGGQIISNSASGNGGGVYVNHISATVTLTNVSTIAHNSASYGGGIYIKDSPAVIQGSIISANYAIASGGGLFLSSSDATLINSVFADNEVGSAGKGSGLYIGSSSPRLLHTTIARNGGGDGSGVYVTKDDSTYSDVTLTNTILVSHTVGITVSAGCRVTLEATLWGDGVWTNDTDWGGAGTIITSTVNVWGDPAFVDSDTGDFHIRVGSAAFDAGVNAGVSTDIDGQVRPLGAACDIGADEWWGASTIYLPLVLRRWPPVPDLSPINNTDGNGNYDVCWSVVERANDYVLQEAIYCDFNGWKGVYTGTDTRHSITDKGPTRYYYRVKARDGWPDDAWSNVQSVDVLWEKEPNDDALTEAKGPIVSDLAYYGTFPNASDVKDYFYFDLSTPHTVEIWLTNIPAGHDYHLCLRDASLDPAIKCSSNPGNADEHILTGVLPAQRYYIQVFNASETGSSQPYHLRADYGDCEGERE